MGVHAPDIKEEYKEFKESWRGAGFEEPWRGAALACATDKPTRFVLAVCRDWNP